jgi:hypothetical protein
VAIKMWNILPAIAILFRGGCESAFVIDSDGFIQVAIRTGGPDPDTDGYSLSVDGQTFVLPAAGSLSIQLPQGSHDVRIDGLAENCSVEGANPRTVMVGASGTAAISFVVVCARVSGGTG